MTIATQTHRAIAVLKLPRNTATLIACSTQIVNAMTGNASFPTPTPTLAALQAATTELLTAQTAAQTHAQGAVALRNAKRQLLVTLLEEVRTYVQSTADASPESGPAIIQSAGLALRRTPVRVARGFHVRTGGVSGTAKLSAPAAARRASYEWAYSTDAGATWVSLPPTLQARTSTAGLKPQTSVLFRYRAVTKGGESDWNPAVTYLVP